MMAARIRKVVFPVAGLGTRFLPATKTIPKEMLPVVDKPLIQYAVEEALEAGIEHFIFITGRGKGAIEDHFDHAYELEATLKAKDKHATLDILSASMLAPGQAAFIRQQQPHGLGHAVWCAHEVIGDEPFAVILPDDMVLSTKGRGCLTQMVGAFKTTGGNIIAVEDVPREHTNRYGIVAPGKTEGRLVEVTGLVEKPDPSKAPSTLSIIGRYILLPGIFGKLKDATRGAGNEIQLTDAMARTIGEAPFHGLRFEGTRYDCGDKLGFLAANIAYGLARKDLASGLRDILRSFSNQKG